MVLLAGSSAGYLPPKGSMAVDTRLNGYKRCAEGNAGEQTSALVEGRHR